MKTSQNGINLLKQFEGCRLSAYWDNIGKCYTIGYGHTKSVTKNMVINFQKATELLKEDLEYFEVNVESLVNVPLNQNQFDALVSFAYNCGVYAFKTSTLLQKLLSYDYRGASNEFLRWCKDGDGNTVQGLLNRRKAEQELFNKSVSVYRDNTIHEMQCVLNKCGYRDKNFNKLDEDGILGELTISALPILFIGYKNDVVKWVQKKLNIQSDGIFGIQTRDAVMSFQKSRNLLVDGVIGKNTWKELLR